MIKSVKIKFTNGDELEVGELGEVEEKISTACWLKRHDTFKIVLDNRTLYIPDRDIKVVEIKRSSSEEEL